MCLVRFSRVCALVFCIAAAVRLVGSVVDNSGREPWNSCPEEHSALRSLHCCTVTEQHRADGLSFYPRVMWSIKPAAALPWMGRHTPAHSRLSSFQIHPLFFAICNFHPLFLPLLHTFEWFMLAQLEWVVWSRPHICTLQKLHWSIWASLQIRKSSVTLWFRFRIG